MMKSLLAQLTDSLFLCLRRHLASTPRKDWIAHSRDPVHSVYGTPAARVRADASGSTPIGKVYVTRTDGSRTILESAFIRSDSIVGKERMAVASTVRNHAIPLTAVRSVEQEHVEV